MAKILLIDDDPGIRDVVRYALTRDGHTVLEAADGICGLDLSRREAPALIILDVGMPEMDGTEVCRLVRKDSNVPIIFLSCRDDEIDRVLGLELGGDDYVTKPFSPRELSARVKALLRRASPLQTPESSPEGPDALERGALRLDLAGHRATWAEQEVDLTATEFALLRTLAERPNRVLSRQALMDGAYGPGHFVSDRTVDSHLRRIRAKFEAVGGAPIITVHGVGYKLASEP